MVIVASRTILGFGASILGVGRAYIAKQTSKAERGPYIAVLCALQYAGFTLTAFISMIDFQGVESLSLTKYNLPGFVLVVSYVVGIAFLLAVPNTLFDSESGHTKGPEPRPAMLGSTKYHNSSYPYLMQLEKSAENLGAGDGEPGEASPGGVQGDPSSLKRLLAVPGIVAIFVLLNFTVRAILATLETLSTYIISYLYTGSMDEAVWRADGAPFRVSETFTAIGLGGLVVFAGVYYLSGHFQDRVTLLLGLSFILAGLGLTLDPRDGEGLGREMSLMRFEAGLAAVWGIGYPLAQSESSPNSNANNLDSAGDLLLTCAATSLPPPPPAAHSRGGLRALQGPVQGAAGPMDGKPGLCGLRRQDHRTNDRGVRVQRNAIAHRSHPPRRLLRDHRAFHSSRRVAVGAVEVRGPLISHRCTSP